MGYSLIYTPVLHFDDINGRPLVGGKLYTYKAGTSTPEPTYRNSAGTELNENPILLNERGECVCFLDDGLKYKFVLKDTLDNTIWEQDNVSIPAGEGGGGGGGDSTIHHLSVQYGFLHDMDNNVPVLGSALDEWIRNNEDVILYDIYESQDGDDFTNTAYHLQFYQRTGSGEGQTRIQFSKVGNQSTPAKLSLYAFLSNEDDVMKPWPIVQGGENPWTIDVGSPTPMYGHFLCEGWFLIADREWHEVSTGLRYSEGNIPSIPSGYGVWLPAGIYDVKVELAFNLAGNVDSNKWQSYDLKLTRDGSSLREMTFTFNTDSQGYILTEWAGFTIEVLSDGYIVFSVKSNSYTNPVSHDLKVSHVFVHKID